MSRAVKEKCPVCAATLRAGAWRCHECESFKSWTVPCSNCGALGPEGAHACHSCEAFPGEGKPCKVCKAALPPGASYCARCASPQAFGARYKLGTAALPLLVGLFGLIGLTVQAIERVWPFYGSDTEVSFVGLGDTTDGESSGKIYVLVTNSGRRPSAVASARLTANAPEGECADELDSMSARASKEIEILEPPERDRIVAPGTSVIFTLRHRWRLKELGSGLTEDLEGRDDPRFRELIEKPFQPVLTVREFRGGLTQLPIEIDAEQLKRFLFHTSDRGVGDDPDRELPRPGGGL